MKRFFCFILLLTFFSAEITSARQKTDKDIKNGTYNMEEIVVTATRVREDTSKIPANVTVIDAEDIKNSNARTVPDLLRSEEGIVVRDLLGNGKREEVDLRGFGESASANTAVLIDGRRVNEIDLSGTDWTQIPLDQIERIEIVRGAGTVLYGDNAVGGVINIITKTPGKKFHARAKTLYGSYGRNKYSASISGGIIDGLYASLFVDRDSTNGYRKNSEFRARDIGGKLVYDATDFLSFNLSGSYHSDRYGMPGALTKLEMHEDRKDSDSPNDGARTRDRYIKFGTLLDMGDFGRIVTDISYRDRNSNSFWTSWSWVQKSNTKTFGLTPRYIWKGSISGHSNTLIAGTDIYWTKQDVDTFTMSSMTRNGYGNIDRNSYGLYCSDEFSILDNLIFSLGIRHERVKYKLKKKDLTGFYSPLTASRTDRKRAYRVGLTYVYSGKSSIFVRFNRSLRFPLTDELIMYDWFNGQIKLNSGLKPQIGKHYEIGIRHYFTPDIRANLTLFRADIKNEIFYNPLTYENTNHQKTRHEGIEIGARADLLKKFLVFANYTYERAKFRAKPFKNNFVPAVPRHRGNLGIQIHNLIPGLIFSANYHWVGSTYLISDQANRYNKLRRYHTADARLSYNYKGIRAFVGVDNITDRKYSEYAVAGWSGASYYPAPERRWTAGIEFGL